MKPKEYIRKYNLDNSKEFNRNLFTADLTLDFQNLIETHQNSGVWSYSKFKLCVSQIKNKYDSIYRRSNVLSSKFWGYFYATVVCPLREELFGEELRRKREEWEERQRENDWIFGGSFAGGFFRSIFESLRMRLPAPVGALSTLGLSEEGLSEDKVNNTYRKLALVYHPDRGGDHNKFIEITEAKNEVLRYLVT